MSIPDEYTERHYGNVEPSTRLYEGTEEGLLAFLISLNMARRHMDESQRAMVAAKIANLRSGARTDLAPIGARSMASDPISQADAAKIANLGRGRPSTNPSIEGLNQTDAAKLLNGGGVNVDITDPFTGEDHFDIYCSIPCITTTTMGATS